MKEESTSWARAVRGGRVGRPLGYAVAAALVSLALPLVAAPSAHAASLPGGLGPCLGSRCPATFPPVHNGPFAGRDENVNIFVGGNFSVRGRAAEAEGHVVTLGDFDQDKVAEASAAYNVGIAGAGSQVPPPNGADFLTAGGDVTVAPKQRLLADYGVVRYAGTATGTITGTKVRDEDAVAEYSGLRDELHDASACYAHGDGEGRPATGTAVNLGYETLFTGDGHSSLQVFNVDFNLTSSTGGTQGIDFTNIPADATVLINLLGGARTINTFSGTLDDTGTWNHLRNRMLWNFPDAAEVTITGSGQFQGSVLVGNHASTSTVSLPGLAGRFFTTGSLVHTSPSAGAEFHAYPFDGDLPDCTHPTAAGEASVKKVDADTGAPLAGATFQLWHETNGVEGLQTHGANPDTKVGSPCVTPDSGVCSVSGLPFGTYYWQETAAPPGYDLPDPSVSMIVLGKDCPQVTVTVCDSKSAEHKGSTDIKKVDADSGEALAGATFQLWHETNGVEGLQTNGANPDMKVGSPCVTPNNGICSADSLPFGTYYWQETAAPPGYELPDPNVFTVVLSEDCPQGSVIAKDAKKIEHTGSTSIEKLDKETGAPLAGATFQLWHETNGVEGLQTNGANPDTKVGSPCVTPNDGICSADSLPFGTYYWQETAAPPGYELPSPSVFTVVLSKNCPHVVVTAKDSKTILHTGSTSIEKLDKETGAPLAGATFQLWHETNGVEGLQTSGVNPDTKVGSPCVTPNDGVCSADNLAFGTYYWEETAAPPGYDLPMPNVFTAVVDEHHPHVTLRAKDSKTIQHVGSTSVEKIDLTSGKPLAGATFQLWHETNGVAGLQTNGANPDTKVGSPCVTPGDGVCSADNLAFGTYYWQETAAPDGYDLPAPNVFLVVLTDDAPQVTVTAKDSKTVVHSGSTSVKKVDLRTGKPLAGATFQLWHETNGVAGLQTNGANPDTKVGSPCVTPGDGVCSADNLAFGTYYWQETAAPDGYRLPARTVSTVVLDQSSPSVTITVKDKAKHRPPLPPTGFSGGEWAAMIGLALLGLGGLTTAAARRRTARR